MNDFAYICVSLGSWSRVVGEVLTEIVTMGFFNENVVVVLHKLERVGKGCRVDRSRDTRIGQSSVSVSANFLNAAVAAAASDGAPPIRLAPPLQPPLRRKRLLQAPHYPQLLSRARLRELMVQINEINKQTGLSCRIRALSMLLEVQLLACIPLGSTQYCQHLLGSFRRSAQRLLGQGGGTFLKKCRFIA
jgi:hypothetical protein